MTPLERRIERLERLVAGFCELGYVDLTRATEALRAEAHELVDEVKNRDQNERVQEFLSPRLLSVQGVSRFETTIVPEAVAVTVFVQAHGQVDREALLRIEHEALQEFGNPCTITVRAKH